MSIVREGLKCLFLWVALISAEDFHPTGEYSNHWLVFAVIVTETLSNGAYIGLYSPNRIQHAKSW